MMKNRSVVDEEELFRTLVEDESERSINERITKSNLAEHERMCRHGPGGGKFGCKDIRVENGEIGSVTLMINTRTMAAATEQEAGSVSINKQQLACDESELSQEPGVSLMTTTTANTTTTATNNQCILLPSTSEENVPAGIALDDLSSILDVLDQRDEHRLYPERSGNCHVCTIEQSGIFWIRPKRDDTLAQVIKSLSDQIGSFIRRTQFKSFGEMGVRPNIYSKCFFRELINTSTSK